ncbi:MAG: AAA family ATPase [Lachnospiraceae bacterium]|nr:AAA family ATPase [Lachnospiraceae bacterium]
MQIKKLHIINFGKLHDFAFCPTEGLNLICERNGWGKSTLAAFIRAMFYGLDYTTKRSLKENDRKHYAPWQGGVFGGSMVFEAAGMGYRVERSFGAKDKEDRFALYDLATGMESADYTERLGEELFHLDREAFTRTFFFRQQDFVVTPGDSLNASLAHAEENAGDMGNYEKAAASLEERMKYFRKTGNRGRLGQLEEERRLVREELASCRERERAAVDWQARLVQKEAQEQALLEKIRVLEAQEEKARSYGEKAARKAQLDLLAEQTREQEEQLRRTAAELGAYTAPPMPEEELDRCYEKICRLKTAREQTEEARQRQYEAEEALAELTEEAPRSSGAHVPLCLCICVLLGVGAVLLWRQIWPGALLMAAALLIAFMEMRRVGQARRQRAELSEEEAAARRELKQAEKNVQKREMAEETLEQQICAALHISRETEPLERLTQLRRESRDYARLRQTYESRRAEVVKSRETYLAFQKRFPEQELLKLQNLEKPERELADILSELQACRDRRDGLLKEERDLQHQLRRLREQAERITELAEEEERLSQEIAAGEREYGLLEKTLKYLKAAKEQFATRYLKELQQGLEYYRKQIEPGVETEALLDVKLKVKAQEAGALRETDYLSTGQQDLLAIAERLAIVDALCEGEQPVLILDDPFVNLDEEKQERAFALLQKLSEKRQMLYFSCRKIG